MLVRHLTEPAPYMGQFLSPMRAHSVSGDTAPAITECHPGPNLTKVGTSPLLEWGRPTSPLQWTNGDGSRWRLSAGGATCRRTAAASAWMGQSSNKSAVAMRALGFKSRTQQMLNASLASSRRPVRFSCSTRSVQLQWRHRATWHAPPTSPLHCDSDVFQNLLKIGISTTQEKYSLTIFNDVTWTGIKKTLNNILHIRGLFIHPLSTKWLFSFYIFRATHYDQFWTPSASLCTSPSEWGRGDIKWGRGGDMATSPSW